MSFPESEKLTLEEATEIAANSECTEQGELTDNSMYNEDTKTWWIDLDMKEEFKKDYCNPACVVKESTKTAEINWRCMEFCLFDYKKIEKKQIISSFFLSFSLNRIHMP